MEAVTTILTTVLTNLHSMNPEQILAIISLSVICFAAFALHVVHSVVKAHSK